ncbi:MAG: hypothetical protein N2B59_03940 [Psychrobacter sp.]
MREIMNLTIECIEKLLAEDIQDLGIGSKELFVRNDTSDKLLIVLSTHNQKNTLFAAKKILSDFDTNILFLTDYNNSYYLENCDDIVKTSYYSRIKKYVEVYGNDRTFIFGSSMAGYAAIKYGEVLNLHIIAMNPQLSIEVSYPSAWPELRNTFNRIKYFQDIDFRKIDNKMFLLFSDHPMDKANFNFFNVSTADISMQSTIHKISSKEHNFPYAERPNVIFEIIKFLELT